MCVAFAVRLLSYRPDALAPGLRRAPLEGDSGRDRLSEFGALNWSIVLAYIAGNLVLGYFLSKRVQTADHYYLGRRTTPWWAIGISVVATYFGALTFLGGPAWSYVDGFSVIFIHINYPIAIFVVVTVFLPFFYKSGVASIFDYLENRFGLTSRTVMSGVFLLGNIAYSGIMLYTTALVLEFITGIPVIDAILIVAVVAVTYTMLGGIAAVIWTDVIQSAILFVGAVITVVLLIGALPESLPVTLEALKETGKTNPFEYSLDPAKVGTIWTGVIAMSIYHVVVYGVNQMMVQRTLAARTLGDAKKAYISMGYVAFLAYVLFFGMGVLFYAYYDGRVFDNENLILLEFVGGRRHSGADGHHHRRRRRRRHVESRLQPELHGDRHHNRLLREVRQEGRHPRALSQGIALVHAVLGSADGRAGDRVHESRRFRARGAEQGGLVLRRRQARHVRPRLLLQARLRTRPPDRRRRRLPFTLVRRDLSRRRVALVLRARRRSQHRRGLGREHRCSMDSRPSTRSTRCRGRKRYSRARGVRRRRTAGTCSRGRSTGRAFGCWGISFFV